MINKHKILIGILLTLFIAIDLTMLSAMFMPEVYKTYALQKINYEFYEIIRWVSFSLLTLISITLYILRYKKYSLITIGLAILFNPFMVIHLTRNIWLLVDTFVILFTVVFQFRDLIFPLSDDEHNPKRLVVCLSNFTRDTPLKWTTHIWDFGSLKNEFGDFKGFIVQVQKKWQEIEKETKILSPQLHKKIENFISDSKDVKKGWFSNENITAGWSSLNGLEAYCDEGKDPFEFQLKEQYIIEGKHIDTFGELIHIFKKEIEVRNDSSMLESLFLKQKKKLGRKFKIELIKLKGKTFYTDVETFNKVLDQIFHGISLHHQYPEVRVEAIEENEGTYVEIKITHIDSQANRTSKTMLSEINDGDFSGIKKSLTNLCDWSIESYHENENYRVNYLKSDTTIKTIEILKYKPQGFTHILRFYYK